MVLDDTMGTSSWLSHCNHPTHKSEFPMHRALAVERERFEDLDLNTLPCMVREVAIEKVEDFNTLPCRVRVVFNLFEVPMVRGFNSECVPRHVAST